MSNNTICPEEIEKFNKIASQWWDEKGKFKPLHQMNPCRINYILQESLAHFGGPGIKGKKLLDVGCGGGLISEPMARNGALVKGIDASELNVKIASEHAKNSGLEIDYECASLEKLHDENFDIILALEIIEHVENVPFFIEKLSDKLNKGGLIFLSTINRTAKSYLFAIIGAEYILRWLPVGTHEWQKFLKPSEINAEFAKNHCHMKDLQGMVFNPLNSKWSLNSKDLSVNYIMNLTK